MDILVALGPGLQDPGGRESRGRARSLRRQGCPLLKFTVARIGGFPDIIGFARG